MFGSFGISKDNKSVPESKLKMKQLQTLLAYLVYNRGKSLYIDSIYSVLWPDDNSDNPSHALRNLIYRLRTLLKEILGSETDYIITVENNSYSWNNTLNTSVDILEFEEAVNCAKSENATVSEKLNYYRKAVELYKGDFLLPLASQDWVIPIATYYRNLYQESVRRMIPLLLQESLYDEALKTCISAVQYDQFNEKLHRIIIEIYFRQNKSDLAINYYKYLKTMFFKELDSALSKETKLLYRQIVTSANSLESDIETIQKTLLEDEESKESPLTCDYETLKYIYSLQVRNLARSKIPQFLFLITLTTQDGKIPPKSMLKDIMQGILSHLQSSLRRNDVISRYSPSQYLLLMSFLSQKDAEMIIERLKVKINDLDKRLVLTFSTVNVGR